MQPYGRRHLINIFVGFSQQNLQQLISIQLISIQLISIHRASCHTSQQNVETEFNQNLFRI